MSAVDPEGSAKGRDGQWLAIAVAAHLALVVVAGLSRAQPLRLAMPPQGSVDPGEEWFVLTEAAPTSRPETARSPSRNETSAGSVGAVATEAPRGLLASSGRGDGDDAGEGPTGEGGGEPGPPGPDADDYDAIAPWEGSFTVGLPWALTPPPAAPNKPPRQRRISGADVTAMLEGDVLAADAKLGLRQPETRKLVDALASQIRHAPLPDGTTVTFAFIVSGDGAVTAVTATTQTAGDSSVASSVAAATAEGLVGTTIRPGAYKDGAIVEIEATVVMSKPSNGDAPVKFEVECPEQGRLGKPKELRDIPDFVPFDPNNLAYGSVAIGGSLYRAPPTVKEYAPCYQLGGSFDMSDMGAKATRQVRTRVHVRPIPK